MLVLRILASFIYLEGRELSVKEVD